MQTYGTPHVRVAEAQVAMGLHGQAGNTAEHAETTARTINDPYSQTNALAQVARALAAAGLHAQARNTAEHAETTARTINDPHFQVSALAQVARALAAAGLHEQSLAVTRSIADPHQRADALAQVAEALVREDDIHLAIREAAAICATETWTIALKPILTLKPSALMKLADVI
jgi:ATP/maltotriose-dependent transcriptional regulator MalT